MRRTVTSLLAATCLLVAGCGSSTSGSAGASATSTSSSAGSEGKSPAVSVVASTNVWGSVAKAIAGDQVPVTSIITKPDQDPHDYEATAQDKLTFEKATVVIYNGGGYDDWATKLAESAKNKPEVIDAVKVSGLKKNGDKDFNEHVFYSLDTAKKVAAQVKELLAKQDPTHADQYAANLKKFDDSIAQLSTKAKKIASDHPGTKAVATEPVTGYLMKDMGIENITPEQFVEQSESDAGPSAAVVDETVKLLSGKKAGLLVLNGQTEDAVSNKLQQAAKDASVPQVLVYETFPSGVNDYATFIDQTISAFAKALQH